MLRVSPMGVRLWILVTAVAFELVAEHARGASPPRRSSTARAAAAQAGIDDGNAGLAALQRGDFDEAIRLFTRALLPGRLTTGDSEFAYLNRGKAHAAKGEFDRASDDLTTALKLNPADADAQTALKDIPEQKEQAELRAAMAPPPVGSSPWGLYSAMVGHCYWYQQANHDPHEAYARFAWVSPQRTLGFQIRTKTQQPIVGEYTLNEGGKVIIYSGLLQEKEIYSTVVVGAQMVADYGYDKSVPSRELIRREGATNFAIVGQIYLDNAWRDKGTAQLVEVGSEELVAAGMIKPRKTCP